MPIEARVCKRRCRPGDAVSALDPFDRAASLRQTAFLFAGRLTTAGAVTFRAG
jgi:hypothetical protein